MKPLLQVQRRYRRTATRPLQDVARVQRSPCRPAMAEAADSSGQACTAHSVSSTRFFQLLSEKASCQLHHLRHFAHCQQQVGVVRPKRLTACHLDGSGGRLPRMLRSAAHSTLGPTCWALCRRTAVSCEQPIAARLPNPGGQRWLRPSAGSKSLGRSRRGTPPPASDQTGHEELLLHPADQPSPETRLTVGQTWAEASSCMHASRASPALEIRPETEATLASKL